MKRNCRKIAFLAVALAALGLQSCATRSALRLEKLADAASRNDFLPAIEDIRKNPKLYGKTNRFLYYMDMGVLYHYAQNFDSSTANLQRAASVFNDLFAHSVTNEAAAVLTNDNVRPYRSKPYELVLLHQFLLLNYLAQGKTDEALVEVRRVQLLFNEWDRKDKSGTKYAADGLFHYLASIAYDAAGETDNAMISLYKSVGAYKAGPVALPLQVRQYACAQLKRNDRESDIEALGIECDFKADKLQQIRNNQSEIIVIGYAGKGPVLHEQSWWGTYVRDGLLVVNYTAENGATETMALPAPSIPDSEYEKAAKGQKTKSGTTVHIKFALPALKTHRSATTHFSVKQPGTAAVAVTSEAASDLDAQASRRIDDTKGATLARTVVRVVLRTIAAQKTKNELQTNNPLANLLLNIGTDVLADQLEKADTRSCFLIPKTIQIIRIPVSPGTHSLDLLTHGIGGSVLESKSFQQIVVGPGEKRVLFASSLK